MQNTFSFSLNIAPYYICINFDFFMSHLTSKLVLNAENYKPNLVSGVLDGVCTAEYSICHTRQKNYCISDDEFLFSCSTVILVQ